MDFISPFIHNELLKIENNQMSFEFTGAWVLKYCLDYLLPDIDVNEIYVNYLKNIKNKKNLIYKIKNYIIIK
jgi:hypothetical protein